MTMTGKPRVRASGVELEIERHGKGDPLLVLYSEEALELQSPFLDALAKTHELIIPSLPDFGRSERLDWITDPDDIVYIFLDLVEQLGVMRVPVLGFSLGGRICKSGTAAQQAAEHAGGHRMKTGHYVSVDGIRTHYLEAGAEHRGKRPSVLLLHSGEFGGCAEFTWEHNLTPLGKEFHVLAPDHLGFGLTDKVFDFCGQFERRITHIRRFIETMCVGPVHIIGVSMSGGLSLAVAARQRPDWPFASLTVCSGGGEAPDNEFRKVLNSYDGTREHMRRIVGVIFYDSKYSNDEAYIERRVEMAALPGAWEATQAARFRAPFRQSSTAKSERDNIDYAAIKVPTLVFAGRHDRLRYPGYSDAYVPKIPNAQLHMFENAAHMGNVECADEFNARTLTFLNMVSPLARERQPFEVSHA